MVRIRPEQREDEQRQERVGALVGCEPTDEAEEDLARVEQLDELSSQRGHRVQTHLIARRLVRVDAAELVARELEMRRAVGHRRQVEVLLADPGEEADALVQDVIALEIVRGVGRARLERERWRERLIIEAVLSSQRCLDEM